MAAGVGVGKHTRQRTGKTDLSCLVTFSHYFYKNCVLILQNKLKNSQIMRIASPSKTVYKKSNYSV